MIRTPRRLAAALAALALIGSTAPAAADPSPRRITVSLRDVPVSDVFEMLSRTEKINVLVGKGVTGNVSVNLYNVSADEAVRTVAEAAGYVAARCGDTYLVVERKDAGLDGLSGNTRLRTFKVQYSNPKTVADILTKHISRYGKMRYLRSKHSARCRGAGVCSKQSFLEESLRYPVVSKHSPAEDYRSPGISRPQSSTTIPRP